jgi:hypothetical protein
VKEIYLMDLHIFSTPDCQNWMGGMLEWRLSVYTAMTLLSDCSVQQALIEFMDTIVVNKTILVPYSGK